MKKLFTYLTLIALFYFIAPPSSLSQQDNYRWRLGVYGGLTTYHGDLNSRILAPNEKLRDFFKNLDHTTYGISVAWTMNRSWGARILATKGEFIANDRATDWSGNLSTESEYFGRSLNVRTELLDASFLFDFHLDNGYILGRKAVVAPYVFAGLGFTSFNTYGDLFTMDGLRYHYWPDNTIRSEAIDSPNADQAQIIEQDGEYETKLSDLNTEGVDYRNTVLNIPFGMGIKFRLSPRLNLNLETILRYMTSDYLDDVSGDFPASFDNNLQEYASNPNNWQVDLRGNDNGNDWLAFTSLSLHYNFGRKKDAFIAPVIYTGDLKSFLNDDSEEKNVNTEVNTEHIVSAQSLDMTIDSSEIAKDIVAIETISTKQIDTTITVVVQNIEQTIDSLETAPADSIKVVVTVEIVQDTSLTDSLHTIISEIVTSDTSVSISMTFPEDSLNTTLISDTLNSIVSQLVISDSNNHQIIIEIVNDTIAAQKEELEVDEKNVDIPTTDSVGIKIQQEAIVGEKNKEQEETNAIASGIQTDTLLAEKMTSPIDTTNQSVKKSSDDIIEKLIQDAQKQQEEENIKLDSLTATPTPEGNIKKVGDNNELNASAIITEEQAIVTDRQERMFLDLQQQIADLKREQGVLYRQLSQDVGNDNQQEIDRLNAEVQALQSAYYRYFSEQSNQGIQPGIKDTIVYAQNTSDYYRLSLELESLKNQMQILIDRDNTGNDLDRQLLQQQLGRSQQHNAITPVQSTNQSITNDQQVEALQTEVRNLKSQLQRKDVTADKQLDLLTQIVAQMQSKSTPVATSVLPIPIPANNNQEVKELQQSVENLEKKLTESQKLLEQSEYTKKDNSELALQIMALQKALEAMKEKEAKVAEAPPVVAPTPALAPVIVTIDENQKVKDAIRGKERRVVFFKVGSSALSPEAGEIVKEMATILLMYPILDIKLLGFTDKSGNPITNLELSRKRAFAVRDYLMMQGINPNQISSEYRGQDESSNPAYGRRVELHLKIGQ